MLIRRLSITSLEDEEKFDETDIGLELPPFEYPPPDSLLLTDSARSRSVIRAKSALCDLKRKCCSLVLRGLDWVGGLLGKNSSPPSALGLLRDCRESVFEFRLIEVGVISGVGSPAMLMVTLLWEPEEDRLYEMLLLRVGFDSSSSLELLGVWFSSFSMARFSCGRREAGVGEMMRELRRDCLVKLSSSDGTGLGVRESDRKPLRGLGVSVGVGRP